MRAKSSVLDAIGCHGRDRFTTNLIQTGTIFSLLVNHIADLNFEGVQALQEQNETGMWTAAMIV